MTPPAETDKRQPQEVYAVTSTDGSPRSITGTMETPHSCSALDQTTGTVIDLLYDYTIVEMQFGRSPLGPC